MPVSRTVVLVTSPADQDYLKCISTSLQAQVVADESLAQELRYDCASDWRFAYLLLDSSLDAPNFEDMLFVCYGLTVESVTYLMITGIIADLEAVRTGKMVKETVNQLWSDLVKIGCIDMDRVGLMPSEAREIFQLTTQQLLDNAYLWVECELPMEEVMLLTAAELSLDGDKLGSEDDDTVSGVPAGVTELILDLLPRGATNDNC